MPLPSPRGMRGIRAGNTNSSSLYSINATEAKQRISAEEKKHLKKTLSTIEKDSLRYRSSFWKPWLDEDGNVIWSASRIWMAEVVLSQMFETVMGVIIAGNIMIMVFETDADATCYPDYADDFAECPTSSASILWLQVLNIALLVIYSVECCARAYVERKLYFWNKWNQIDLMTVTLGWLGVLLSTAVNLNVLRIFRVIRLMRAARVVISVPEFYILVSGLSSSFKAIVFGSVMLVAVILVWAIISVELLHPINVNISYPTTCPRCATGFRSVQDAALTLFQQIVAGDSWGEISLPLAEKEPWIIPVLFFIVMTISLGVMNLILAVIVERAAEARENDQTRKMQKKDAEREKHMVELALLCDSMDQDGSGSLSLEEMLNGFDENSQFSNLMQVMDIRRADMETIFNVLDSDSSGEVSYVEFCQQLGNFRKRDPLMMNSLIRYSVMELRKLIHKDVMNLMNEHTELLTEQSEMLTEQLDLLASIPGLEEKAKEASTKRRTAKVLRRQGRKQGQPRFLEEGGEDPFAASYAAAEDSSKQSAVEIVKSLEATSKDFDKVQGQLNSLLARAEQLTLAALDGSIPLPSPSDPALSRVGSRATLESGRSRAVSSVPSESGLSAAAKEAGIRFERRLHPVLEEHYASLLSVFQKRVQEEEVVQQRYRHVIRCLDSLMEGKSDPGIFFPC